MKKFYFAYGSNMSQSRLEERIGKVRKVGTHRLFGWRLTMNAGNDRAFANAEMTGMDHNTVDGVVYELTSKQMRQLDQYEGCPVCYQRIIVENYMGKNLYAYISFNPMYRVALGVRPEPYYLEHIIRGAKENNLLGVIRQLPALLH